MSGTRAYSYGALGALVLDGQYNNRASDQQADRIVVGDTLRTASPYGNVGTWLNREVTTVSEPTTAVMFTLGLMGLFVRRRLG